MQYVELECGFLYDSHKEVNQEEEQNAIERILRLLRLIGYDSHYNDEVSAKTSIELCDKALLKLFGHLSADYICENRVVATIIVKLLSKLNLLDEINKLKGKNVPFQRDTFLKDPLVCTIRQTLASSDYESDLDDDDDDLIISDDFFPQKEVKQDDLSQKPGFSDIHFSASTSKQEVQKDLENRKDHQKSVHINSRDCNLINNHNIQEKSDNFLQAASTANSQNSIEKNRSPTNPEEKSVPLNFFMNEISQSAREFFPVEISKNSENGIFSNHHQDTSSKNQENNCLINNRNQDTSSKNQESNCLNNHNQDASLKNQENNCLNHHNQDAFSKKTESHFLKNTSREDKITFTKFDEYDKVRVVNSQIDKPKEKNSEKSLLTSQEIPVIEIDDNDELNSNGFKKVFKFEKNTESSSNLTVDLNSIPDNSCNTKTSSDILNGGIITIDLLDDDDDDELGANSNGTESQTQITNLLQTNEIKQENEENRSPNFPVSNTENNDQNFMNSDKSSRNSNSTGLGKMGKNSKDCPKEMEPSAIVISDSEDELVDGASESNDLTRTSKISAASEIQAEEIREEQNELEARLEEKQKVENNLIKNLKDKEEINSSEKTVTQQEDNLFPEKTDEVLEEFQDFMDQSIENVSASQTIESPVEISVTSESLEAVTAEESAHSDVETFKNVTQDQSNLHQLDFNENAKDENISVDKTPEPQIESEISVNTENVSILPEDFNFLLPEEKLPEPDASLESQDQTLVIQDSPIVVSTSEAIAEEIQENREIIGSTTPNEENLQEIHESIETNIESSQILDKNDNNEVFQSSISTEIIETQVSEEIIDSRIIESVPELAVNQKQDLEICEPINPEVDMQEEHNINIDNFEDVSDVNDDIAEASETVENLAVAPKQNETHFQSLKCAEEVTCENLAVTSEQNETILQSVKCVEEQPCEVIDYSVSHPSEETVNYEPEQPQATNFYQINDKSAIYTPQLQNSIPSFFDSEKLDKPTNLHEPLFLLADAAANRETLAVKTDSEKETVASDLDNREPELDLSQTTPRRRKSKLRFDRKKKSPRQGLPRAAKQAQRSVFKQKITFDEFENKRVTRNMGKKSKIDTNILKETQKQTRVNRNEDSKYKPHDFISIENAILPPVTNNVYAQKRLIDTTTTSEDSNDSCESTLFIDLGDNVKHPEKIVKSIYDEETVSDDLEFFNFDNKAAVCISIPEIEDTYVSDSFHILKQMEDFVDKNKDVVSSEVQQSNEIVEENIIHTSYKNKEVVTSDFGKPSENLHTLANNTEAVSLEVEKSIEIVEETNIYMLDKNKEAVSSDVGQSIEIVEEKRVYTLDENKQPVCLAVEKSSENINEKIVPILDQNEETVSLDVGKSIEIVQEKNAYILDENKQSDCLIVEKSSENINDIAPTSDKNEEAVSSDVGQILDENEAASNSDIETSTQNIEDKIINTSDKSSDIGKSSDIEEDKLDQTLDNNQPVFNSDAGKSSEIVEENTIQTLDENEPACSSDVSENIDDKIICTSDKNEQAVSSEVEELSENLEDQIINSQNKTKLDESLDVENLTQNIEEKNYASNSDESFESTLKVDQSVILNSDLKEAKVLEEAKTVKTTNHSIEHILNKIPSSIEVKNSISGLISEPGDLETISTKKCEPENTNDEQKISYLEPQNSSIEIDAPSVDDSKALESLQNCQNVSKEISTASEETYSEISIDETETEESKLTEPEKIPVQPVSLTVTDDVCEKAFKTKAAMKSYEDRLQENSMILSKTTTVFESVNETRIGPRLRSRSSDLFFGCSTPSERNRSVSVDFNSMSFSSESSHDQSSSEIEDTQVNEYVIDSVIEPVEETTKDLDLVENTDCVGNSAELQSFYVTPKEVEDSSATEIAVISDISVYHSSEVVLESSNILKNVEEAVTENLKVIKDVPGEKLTENIPKVSNVDELKSEAVSIKHHENSSDFCDQVSKTSRSNLKKHSDKSSSKKNSKSKPSDEVKGRALENTIKTLKEKIQVSVKAKNEVFSETSKEIENIETVSPLNLLNKITHVPDDLPASKERKHHKKTHSEERPRSTDSNKEEHKKRRSSRSLSKSRSDKSDHSDKERQSHSRSSSKSRSSDKRSKHHSDNEIDRKRRSSSKSIDDKDKRSALHDDSNGHKKKRTRSSSKSKNSDDKSKRGSVERTSSKHKSLILKEKINQNEDERNHKKRSTKSPSIPKLLETKDKQMVEKKKGDEKSENKTVENKIKTDEPEILKAGSLEGTKSCDHKSSKDKPKKSVSSKHLKNYSKILDQDEKIEKLENKSHVEVQKSSDKEKRRDRKSKSRSEYSKSVDNENKADKKMIIKDDRKDDNKNLDKFSRSHSNDKIRLDNNHRNDKRDKSDKYKDTSKRKEKKKEEKVVISECKLKEYKAAHFEETTNIAVSDVDQLKDIVEIKETQKTQKVDIPKKRKCFDLEATPDDLPPVKIAKVPEEVLKKSTDKVIGEIESTGKKLSVETVSSEAVVEVESSTISPNFDSHQPEEGLPITKKDVFIETSTYQKDISVVPLTVNPLLSSEKDQTLELDSSIVTQSDESSADMEICENVPSNISEAEISNKSETHLIMQNQTDPITSSASVPIYVSAVFSSSSLVQPIDTIVKHLPGQDSDLSLTPSVSTSLSTDCIASTSVSISCTVSTTVPLDSVTTSADTTCLFTCSEDAESVNRENIPPSEIFHTPIGLDDISPTKLPLACNQSLDFISPSTSISEISNSMNLVQSLESSAINFEVPDTSEIDIQPTNKQNSFCSNFVTRVTEISCFVDKESNADHNYTGGDPLLGGNNEDKDILTTGLSLSNPKEFPLNESHLEDLSFGKNYFIEENGTLEELELLPPCKKEKPDFDTIIDDPIPKPEDIQVSLKQLNMLMDNPQSSQPKTNSVDNTNMINTSIPDLGFEYAVNEILSFSQNTGFPAIQDIENITESNVPVIPQTKLIPTESQKDKSNDSNSLIGSNCSLPPVCTSFSSFVSENQKVIVQPVEHFSITSVDQLKSDFITESNKNDDNTKAQVKPIDTNGKLQPKYRPKKFATFLEVVKNEANKIEPPKVKDEMEIYTLRRHNRTPVVSSKKKVINQSPPTKSPENTTKSEGRIRVKTDLIKTVSKSDGEYSNNEHDVASDVVLPFNKPSPSILKIDEKKPKSLPKMNSSKHPRFDKKGNDYIMENILNNSLRKSSTPDAKKREESLKISDKKRKSLDEMSSDEKRARKLEEDEKKSANHVGSPVKNSANHKCSTDEIFDALRRQGPVNKEYIRQLEEQKKKQGQNSSLDPLNRGYTTEPNSKKDRNSLPQSTSTFSHDSSKYKDIRYQKKPEFQTNSNSHADRRHTEKSHISVPTIDPSRKRHIKNCGNSANIFPNSTKPSQRKEEDKFSWLDKFSGSGLFDPPPDLFMPPGTDREDKSS